MDQELIVYLDERFCDSAEQIAGLRQEIRKAVEIPFKHLDRRVALLEDRAALEGQAPLDIIRERYGRKTT
ncbi:MAG TPA: hypothetical protein VGR07_08555 [Thermoanaerobaculia bacterium]|jgi:hypothetical protein|nr:hypothetical protein [Thermoanaerobaculia bacterium]